MKLLIMGVTGSGKTAIGQMLAKELNMEFQDGDDLHPKTNIEKMKRGIPLDDNDRLPWLSKIKEIIENKANIIVSCSALKESYRKLLTKDDDINLVYLKGDFNTIQKRLENRKEHFMNPNLLKSQFEILEEPKNAINVDISNTPKSIVRYIKESLTTK